MYVVFKNNDYSGSIKLRKTTRFDSAAADLARGIRNQDANGACSGDVGEEVVMSCGRGLIVEGKGYVGSACSFFNSE